jgi:hypothetical protein
VAQRGNLKLDGVSTLRRGRASRRVRARNLS